MTGCSGLATSSDNSDLSTPIELLQEHKVDSSKYKTIGDIVQDGYPEALKVIELHNIDKASIKKLEAKRKAAK